MTPKGKVVTHLGLQLYDDGIVEAPIPYQGPINNI